MFGGQYLSILPALSIPPAPAIIQTHPFSRPDVTTALQLVSQPSLLSKGLFFHTLSNFLTQKYAVAPLYAQNRVQTPLSFIQSFPQPGPNDFFPVISLSPPSLAFTHSSSSFPLHILQFTGFMPSLCLENSPSPTLISIYLNLAHLYQLELVRKNRDQN